jgi:hypothetical protein
MKKIKCANCCFCENIHHQFGTKIYLGKCTAISELKGLPCWVSKHDEWMDVRILRYCETFGPR